MLYKELFSPITLQVELNSACNNNCIHCYNHWRHGEEKNVTSLNEQQLFHIIEEIVKNNIFQVTLTGGEPTLSKDILYFAVEKLVSNKIGCSVNSNLINFSKEDGGKLYNLGLRGMLTSICSSDREKHDYIVQHDGAYEKTIAGISNAIESGLKVASSMVVSNLNKDDVVKTALVLKKIGVTQFYATKASPPINAINFQKYMLTKDELMKVLDDLFLLKEKHGLDVGILECYPLCLYKDVEKYNFASNRRCSAGITTCTIGANGEVRSCSHSDKVYGNIFEEKLKNIWTSMNDCRDGSQLPKICLECNFLSSCSGGCRVDAKYISGINCSLDPYSIADKIGEIKIDSSVISTIKLTKKLKVNSNLVTRNEKDGILVADSRYVGKPVFLTKDTYEVVEYFKDREFSTDELIKELSIPSDIAENLCKLLVKDRIFFNLIPERR